MPKTPRPENWNNPHHQCSDPCCYHGLTEALAYEAGADAMYPFALEKGNAEGKAELVKLIDGSGLHSYPITDANKLAFCIDEKWWQELKKKVGL